MKVKVKSIFDNLSYETLKDEFIRIYPGFVAAVEDGRFKRIVENIKSLEADESLSEDNYLVVTKDFDDKGVYYVVEIYEEGENKPFYPVLNTWEQWLGMRVISQNCTLPQMASAILFEMTYYGESAEEYKIEVARMIDVIEGSLKEEFDIDI